MTEKALLSDTIILNPPAPPYNEDAPKIDTPPPPYQYPKIEFSGGWKNPIFAVLFWIHAICVIILGLVFGIPALLYYMKHGRDDDRAQTVPQAALQTTTQAVPAVAPLNFDVQLFLCIFLGSAFIGGFTSFVALFILQRCAGRIIKCSLYMTLIMQILMCGGLFMVFWPLGFLPLIGVIFTIWYIYYVRNRIAFAEAHLQVGCAALRSHPSLAFVAIGMLVVQFLWIVFWSLMALGIGHTVNTHILNPNVNATTNLSNTSIYLINTKPDQINTQPYWITTKPNRINRQAYQNKTKPNWFDAQADMNKRPLRRFNGTNDRNKTESEQTHMEQKNQRYIGGIMTFILLISLYWGVITFRNVVHFITACVVGQWWFETDTNGQYAIGTSVKRAFTTNFGTISFGSLLVAVIKALRTCAESNNRGGGNIVTSIISCCAICILRIVEKLLGYLNEWAFIYAALTGQAFIQASRSFIELFKDRGWTMIINDDLTGTALSLVTFVVGLISATSGGLVVYFFLPDSQHRILIAIIAAGLSFIMGISMSTVMTSILTSCVRTAFVCFALNPAALGLTHPEHLTNLINAWHKFHPEEYTASGYAQHLPPPSYAESV